MRITPWTLVILTALLSVVALSYEDIPGWVLAGALLAPAMATALLAVAPLVALGICVALSMTTALAMDSVVPPWSVALIVALGVISFLAGRRIPRAAPAVAIFAVGAALGFPLGDVWPTGILLLAISVVVPWLLGRSVRQQSELVAAAADQARLQERTRIAHDMHDTLGHELSLLALRAGALEMAPDLQAPQRAAVTELRAGAGSAIERLAEIVGVLRDDSPPPLTPLTQGIEDLVDRAAQAGMEVSLEWDGPRELPPMVDQAAHRVVQEALTNAMKHAQGTPVQVRLTTTATATEVTVTNSLRPSRRRGAGGRVGLVALQERVRLVGGKLRAGPHGRTFEVVALLPHMGES